MVDQQVCIDTLAYCKTYGRLSLKDPPEHFVLDANYGPNLSGRIHLIWRVPTGLLAVIAEIHQIAPPPHPPGVIGAHPVK